MEKDWVKIYSDAALHKVEMLKALLEEKEINAVIINNQDSFYKTIGEVELYVNRDFVILAKQLINKAIGE